LGGEFRRLVDAGVLLALPGWEQIAAHLSDPFRDARRTDRRRIQPRPQGPTMPASHHHHYNDDSFWSKCGHALRAAGREVIEKALWLYYALQRPETPAWAKAVIVGALGYFISPVDAVPDPLPVVGFSDDLAVLAGALATVAAYIDAEVKAKAARKLADWGMG
jgi:uncharacterized membrane protein YkvA (DUF1232 family)